MDEVERTRLLQEAEDIERQEKLAMDKADFEAEKRRKANEDATKATFEKAARLTAIEEEEAKRRQMGTQMSQDANLSQKVQDSISEKKLE